MEDGHNYLGEMELDLLTPRDHSLPSSQKISTPLGFHCPIKESYMDHVREGPRYHLYVVGFKSGIEEKERVAVNERFHGV